MSGFDDTFKWLGAPIQTISVIEYINVNVIAIRILRLEEMEAPE